jgi:uncharacterized membrane protein
MKIFGHPVHIMLIHFPSALFPMDWMCSFLAFYYQDNSFAQASFYAMVGGVTLGSLAIIAGASDLLGVAANKPSSIKKVLLHGGINSTVVIVYIVLTFIAFKKYPQLEPDGISKIIFKGGLITFMIFGNHLGGNLILKDKI